jgi:hypothetical protein
VKSRGDGNQGSLFWFTFPYRPCFDNDMNPPSGREGDFIASPDSRRILLVDDSLSILKVILHIHSQISIFR